MTNLISCGLNNLQIELFLVEKYNTNANYRRNYVSQNCSINWCNKRWRFEYGQRQIALVPQAANDFRPQFTQLQNVKYYNNYFYYI